jgi:hypothetical protein
MPPLLLLCRHPSRSDEDVPEAPAELVAVAERLKETLAHDGVELTAIRHSRVGAGHARWLKQRLVGPQEPRGFSITADERLEPEAFTRWKRDEDADELVTELIGHLTAGGSRAVLVVGHMPQLGWLGSRLLGNRSPWSVVRDGFPTPVVLEHAEVAAIAIEAREFRNRPAGRLDWFVTRSETQAIDALREKIKSKMDIAKLLGGFMTLVLSAVLLAPGRLDELRAGGNGWAVSVAAVAFLIAIGLYLATMYAYDTLLMPKRYWGEDGPGGRRPGWLVRRPPSGAAWVLYQNMLYIWTFVFTPATAAVILALLALAYAALDPGWLDVVLASLVFVAVAVYVRQHRPVLGSHD